MAVKRMMTWVASSKGNVKLPLQRMRYFACIWMNLTGNDFNVFFYIQNFDCLSNFALFFASTYYYTWWTYQNQGLSDSRLCWKCYFICSIAVSIFKLRVLPFLWLCSEVLSLSSDPSGLLSLCRLRSRVQVAWTASSSSLPFAAAVVSGTAGFVVLGVGKGPGLWVS